MQPRPMSGASPATPARGALTLEPEAGRLSRPGRPNMSASADASPDEGFDPGPHPEHEAAEAEAELYTAALTACIVLATDPAPRVACLGRAALRVAGCTLTPATPAAGVLLRVMRLRVPPRECRSQLHCLS